MPIFPNTPTRKDPDSELSYDMDWGPWLAEQGEGVELAGVEVDVFLVDEVTPPPSGEDDTPLVVVGTPVVSAGDGDVAQYVICRLAGGGVAGHRETFYAVRYRVTTTAGDVEDATRFVKVRNR